MTAATRLDGSAAIALTCGDPAGIGLECAIKAWCARKQERLAPFYLIAQHDDVKATAEQLACADDLPLARIAAPHEALAAFDHALPLFDLAPYCAAQDQAQSCITAIKLGVEQTRAKHAAALVTNPLNKYKLYQAGFDFPGHTEFLAHLACQDKSEQEALKSVMMLACDELKVVPATLHVSLKEAIAQLNPALLTQVLEITHHFMMQHFGLPQPRIAVAGLNPHAGEQGSMGSEEVEWITALLQDLRTTKGWQLLGPLPADTLFHARARQAYDVAVCMYHDQALIPIKTLAFDEGVNITMGLDFVRTSPDHGTAYDIAGKGIARADSLCAALRMAQRLTQRSAKQDQSGFSYE